MPKIAGGSSEGLVVPVFMNRDAKGNVPRAVLLCPETGGMILLCHQRDGSFEVADHGEGG